MKEGEIETSTDLQKRDQLFPRSLRAEGEGDSAKASDGGESKDNIVRLELIHEEVDGVERVWVRGRHGGGGGAGEEAG
jgi:hypothetical protein